MGNKETRFNKHDIIKSDEKLYKCILCDSKLAIFVSLNTTTHFESNFVVDNGMEANDNFEYSKLNEQTSNR